MRTRSVAVGCARRRGPPPGIDSGHTPERESPMTAATTSPPSRRSGARADDARLAAAGLRRHPRRASRHRRRSGLGLPRGHDRRHGARSRRPTLSSAPSSPPGSAAERLVNALKDRPTPPLDADGPMRLGDLPAHGDWVKFSDDPPWELTFGVIGRFWGGETVWETIDAADFAAFDAARGSRRSRAASRCAPTGARGPSSPTRPARRRSTRTPARTSSATGASSAPASRSSCAPSWRLSRRRCADARRP